MAWWLECWIPNPEFLGPKPLSGSKVDSRFSSFQSQPNKYQEILET